MEVPKGHSAQLPSGRASVFPSSSLLPTFRHSPGHSPPPLPLYLSLIHPSGAHSAVFQESQDKQWEFEMPMATQLMTRGCATSDPRLPTPPHSTVCTHTLLSLRALSLCVSLSRDLPTSEGRVTHSRVPLAGESFSALGHFMWGDCVWGNCEKGKAPRGRTVVCPLSHLVGTGDFLCLGPYLHHVQ